MGDLNSSLAAVAEQLLAEKHEPIAIVGVGLRLSAGITDLDGFHRLLIEGEDNIVPIPTSRWNNQQYHAGLNHSDNLICTNEGGYLDDLDKFDPGFFSISPKEARYMDPQQRVMLELCWHALEHAGLNPEELRGGDGAVYLGSSSLDYARAMMKLDEPQLVSQLGTGTANSAISGRISYFLGWRGPCMTLDTACSSSLVAIHLASTALRNRETSIALAGGINIVHDPVSHIIFTRANMLAPDGRCKTFDESADGYGRSEGAAVLVLRRLSDAVADRNRILALVRGSAVRQDGESGGLTVPNGRAQEAVMREALRRSLLTPTDVSYIEAHGTGTPLGDPIEIHSINSLFSNRENLDQPVYVASSKTNLGHMEAAAGVGGVIKCLMQLENGVIYPHIQLKTPSSKIDWSSLTVTVPTTQQSWDRPVRRALVNSFGFAGTIASVVLEQAPQTIAGVAPEPAPSDSRILPVSAKSPTALIRNLEAHLAALESPKPIDLDRYVWTASVGRQHHAYRWAAPVLDRDQLAQALRDDLRDIDVLTADAEQNQLYADGRVVFLITGQGSQFAGMGASLYRRNQAFHDALDEVARHVDGVLDVGILDLMFDASEHAQARLGQTKYTQPALFAFNYAIARMWMSYGVEPSVLLGHSIGEIVAACLAGLFSLEDAVRMTARRGELMQSVTDDGGMIAVKAPRDILAAYLKPYDDVGFGGFNGPSQTVLSGGLASLDLITRRLSEDGIAYRRLDVSHAFHSVHMTRAANTFRAFMESVAFHPLQREFISNLTGGVADFETVASAEYWARQVCEPVNFEAGIIATAARGPCIFVETGPSPHLISIGRTCVNASEHRWIATIERSVAESKSIERAIVGLYGAGRSLNWRALHASINVSTCDVPAFDKESYWLPEPSSIARKQNEFHPLLGRPVAQDPDRWVFASEIGSRSPAYLADHQVMGRTIFPGTGYVELVLALQDAVFGHTQMTIDALEIHEPLLLSDDSTTELSTLLTRDNRGIYQVEVRSRARDQYRTHFTCRLSDDDTRVSVNDAPDVSHGPALMSVADYGLYTKLTALGLEYGPQFRRVVSLRKEGARSIAGTLSTANIDAWEILNPGLFDGVLHTLGPLLDENRTLIPVGWSQVRVYRKPRGAVVCTAQLHDDCDPFGSEVRADLAIYANGQLAVHAIGLRLREVRSRERSTAHFFHRLAWQEDSVDTREYQAPQTVVVGCPDNLKHYLAPLATIVGDPGHARDALDELALNARSRSQIVWFWHAEEISAEADADSMMNAGRSFYEPLLEFVKSLEHRTLRHLVELCIVTFDGQSVEPFDLKHVTSAPLTFGVQLQASASGFCAVLNSESSRVRARTIDLSRFDDIERRAQSLLSELYVSSSRADAQVAYREGKRLVRRLVPAQLTGDETNFRLTVGDDGLLSSVRPQPIERIAPADNEIEVRVDAAGVNFKDVLNALGLLKKHADDNGTPYRSLPLGFECAGVVAAAGAASGFAVGDKVMVSRPGCMQRYVTVDHRAAVRIPPNISIEQAAAIPTAFTTAYYALYRLANISKSDRVLVHAAAGGVGQAALQLCRRAGAEVFATASRGKWDRLRAQGVRYVMDSRSTGFVDEIARLTGKKGVSVVLNSLNKEFIPAGLKVTAQGGRFIEIGKLGAWTSQQVAAIRPDVGYAQFDLSEMPEDELLLMNHAILDEIAGMLAAGEIAPPPVTCFPVAESADAFGLLARGENIGKIVLTFGEMAHPDLSKAREIDMHGTYLITGGYGALGQRTAQSLVKAGAHHIALLGRHLPDSATLDTIRARLAGAQSVELLTGDVADPTLVERIFTDAENKGRPVRGIVHLAGVINDAPVVEQTWDKFRTTFLPKVAGTWNLWRTAESRGAIDLFACYSSVASVIGSVSQINYAAANAFMDGLMNRNRNGRRVGLSLNWGPWAGAGMAAELTDQQKKTIERKGIYLIPLQRGIEAFGRLVRCAQGQLLIGEVDWHAYKASLPAHDPLYELVDAQSDSVSSETFDVERLFTMPVEQRKEAVVDEVLRVLRQVLQFSDKDRMPRRASFADLGIDSLVAVELRNSLEKSFGVAVPSSLVFDYPTVTVLSTYLLEQLIESRPSGAPETVEPAPRVNRSAQPVTPENPT